MMLKPFFLAVMMALLAGCTSSDSRSAVEAREAIFERNQAWLRAESAKDLPASLEYIHPEGYYLAEGWPTLHGHEEISEFLTAAFDSPMDTIAGGPEFIDVAASGNLGYELGRTQVNYKTANGDTTLLAHYLVVWKRVDGEWQAVATSVMGSR